MLKTIEFSQFGGVNTVLDSSNAGVSEARVCRNFILRPLGGLSVRPGWTAFSPGGIALDLGFITSVKYLLDTGVRLILQSPDLTYWNVTPDVNGLILPTAVSTPSATPQTADLILMPGEYIAFKYSTTSLLLLCDQNHLGWYTQSIGIPTTEFTVTDDMVFTVASGFVLRMEDDTSNTWEFSVSNDGNLFVTTV